MAMTSNQELKVQDPGPASLKLKLSQLLDGSLPCNLDYRVRLLEDHFREALVEQSHSLPVTFSVTPENAHEYADLVRQISIAAKKYKDAQSLELARSSSCDAAAAEGIILISIGCGIHPIAGVVGFMIGVELLMESCG